MESRSASPIKFDGAQIDLVFGGELSHGLDLGGVAAVDVEHARIDGVTRPGKCPRRERAEPAGRAGNQNNFFRVSHQIKSVRRPSKYGFNW